MRMAQSVLITLALALATAELCWACGSSQSSCLATTTKAYAYITPHGSPNSTTGFIYLEQVGNTLKLTGNVTGLSPNAQHGFHIHQYGDLSTGCSGAGGHYNPFNKDHGAPGDSNRHVGDLGNIQANAAGVATVSISDTVASLTSEYSVLGRAIVVHAGVDDLGRGSAPDSKTTGNAGSRLACGVIGIKA